MNETPENSEQTTETKRFTELQSLVTSEFTVEESFIEHDTPTFYVQLKPNSKQAFIKLMRKLDPLGVIPVLRREEGKTVLRIVSKPPVKSSNPVVNVILFAATIGTTLLTGYYLSLDMPNPIISAVAFAAAILAILGTHEMGHKILANKHGVQATAPYFIPGPPLQYGGIGTFGAVIMQKSLPPNRDALFDIGASGPIAGFIVAFIISVIGISLSKRIVVEEPIMLLPAPLVLRFIAMLFPPSGTGNVIELHPVAFAGWVGMLLTMLNLLPAGQLDGGHTIRSLTGGKGSTVFTIFSILLLFSLGPLYYAMAILVLFLSFYQTPSPLDDVSPLSTSRKLTVIALVAIFILCIAL